MAEFPRLKTGAVLQFPSNLTLDFSTDVLRFIDGKEQRFRRSVSVAQRWSIVLDRLDETEAKLLQQFVVQQSGKFGTFSFPDPWDGVVYENCSFENDEIVVTASGAMMCRTELVIRRNRS